MDQRRIFAIAALVWMSVACSNTVGGQGLANGDGDGDGDGGTGGLIDAPPLETNLDGDAFDLGDGLVRLVYDFSDEAQLSDWIASEPTPPNDFYVTDGALLVDSHQVDGSGLLAIEFIRHLSVTHLEFDARIEEGDHINAYINFENSGAWDPEIGVGMIHRSSGVGITQAGQVSEPPDFSPTPVTDGPPIATWVHYILHRDGDQLTVTVDDSSDVITVGNFFPTDRALALGSYTSVVSFDNIVIEGELNP